MLANGNVRWFCWVLLPARLYFRPATVGLRPRLPLPTTATRVPGTAAELRLACSSAASMWPNNVHNPTPISPTASSAAGLSMSMSSPTAHQDYWRPLSQKHYHRNRPSWRPKCRPTAVVLPPGPAHQRPSRRHYCHRPRHHCCCLLQQLALPRPIIEGGQPSGRQTDFATTTSPSYSPTQDTIAEATMACGRMPQLAPLSR